MFGELPKLISMGFFRDTFRLLWCVVVEWRSSRPLPKITPIIVRPSTRQHRRLTLVRTIPIVHRKTVSIPQHRRPTTLPRMNPIRSDPFTGAILRTRFHLFTGAVPTNFLHPADFFTGRCGSGRGLAPAAQLHTADFFLTAHRQGAGCDVPQLP